MPRPKFLLDADMPRSSAAAIRSLGFDVQDVRDQSDRLRALDSLQADFALMPLSSKAPADSIASRAAAVPIYWRQRASIFVYSFSI